MTTFILIPGAGGQAWFWHRLVPELRSQREGRDPDAPFDPVEVFFHDADPDLLAEVTAGPGPAQSDRPFRDPWPLPAWPDVPTRFLAARDDRLFPLDLQRRVVAERLGIEVEETPGGHVSALTQPAAIADLLTRE